RPREENSRPAPTTAGGRGCSQAGALRMTQLHPPVQRGDAAVAGRLVEHRVTFRRVGKSFGVAVLLDLECAESGPQHEHELVAQYLAGGAQLAAITVTFAQQPR